MLDLIDEDWVVLQKGGRGDLDRHLVGAFGRFDGVSTIVILPKASDWRWLRADPGDEWFDRLFW